MDAATDVRCQDLFDSYLEALAGYFADPDHDEPALRRIDGGVADKMGFRTEVYLWAKAMLMGSQPLRWHDHRALRPMILAAAGGVANVLS